MRTVLIFISLSGLCLTIIPAIFVFFGSLDLSSHKNLMILGTFLWFCSAPFWIKKEEGKKRITKRDDSQ